ncbi:MAG: MFS transporter [Acidimicrobiales bacterium]
MKRTVALLALSAVVSHALARSTYPILLPAIEDELLGSHQQSGLLSTVNFAAYLVGVAVVTTISGRAEPVRLLLGGLVAAGLGFVVLARAGGFGQLAIGLALAGAGSAGIWMSTPVLATAAVGPSRRGTVMGVISSTMGVGIVAASQGTNLVRAVGDDDALWRPIWVGAAAFSFALLVATIALLRTPPTETITGGVSMSRLRSVPAWAPLTAGYWLFGIVISGYTPFLGAALEEEGFSRSHVATLYSLFGLAAVVGAVNLGRISDRVGRRPVLLGTMASLAVASLLVLTGREPFATISAVIFGAASFTFPVLIAAYLSDHLRDRSFSNALGALTLVYGTALALGPFIAGTIGDSRLGFDVVFGGVAVLALVGSVFVSRLPRSVEQVRVSPS